MAANPCFKDTPQQTPEVEPLHRSRPIPAAEFARVASAEDGAEQIGAEQIAAEP